MDSGLDGSTPSFLLTAGRHPDIGLYQGQLVSVSITTWGVGVEGGAAGCCSVVHKRPGSGCDEEQSRRRPVRLQGPRAGAERAGRHPPPPRRKGSLFLWYTLISASCYFAPDPAFCNRGTRPGSRWIVALRLLAWLHAHNPLLNHSDLPLDLVKSHINGSVGPWSSSRGLEEELQYAAKDVLRFMESNYESICIIFITYTKKGGKLEQLQGTLKKCIGMGWGANFKCFHGAENL